MIIFGDLYHRKILSFFEPIPTTARCAVSRVLTQYPLRSTRARHRILLNVNLNFLSVILTWASTFMLMQLLLPVHQQIFHKRWPALWISFNGFGLIFRLELCR